MMCRPRMFKAWVRVLTCFLMVSMIQPSLVLCFGPHEDDVVKHGPCDSPVRSASLDQTCDSCADVPSSMADIGGRLSSTVPIGMVSGTPHSAKVASLSRLLFTHSNATFPGVAHRANSRPESAQWDNSCHITIRSTVLLI
jgi:hypothetical protein